MFDYIAIITEEIDVAGERVTTSGVGEDECGFSRRVLS
jgi:hypothetical protein